MVYDRSRRRCRCFSAMIRSLAVRLLGRVRGRTSRLACSTEAAQSWREEDLEGFKASLDDGNRRLLETYVSEYEIFKYADSMMPSKVNVKNWQRLLRMETKLERIQYLTYLYELERNEAKDTSKSEEEVERKVELKRAEIERQREEHIYYGLSGSNIFRRFMECDMNKHLNSKLARAMLHGPHVIVDLSFLPILKPIESSLTAKQIRQIHHDNRTHRFPHHIIFTGCNRQHESWDDVNRSLSGVGLDKLPYTVTEKHYLDLFPKEQLVYLSPDGRRAVNEYDPDKIYIVAAIVDRVYRPNLTLGRAKEEGIEVRRLPLERCTRLIGGKALCLNHVINIMNDAYAYGSMAAAIMNAMPKKKFVPKKSEAPRERRERNRQRIMYLSSLGTPA